MKSRRRILREKILQILYAYEMHGSGLTEIVENQLEKISNKDELEFCNGIVNYIVANRKEINKVIEDHLVNWEVDRIAVVDRLLLQIGIGEMQYSEDIPPKVTINEIIEIAKEFSTAKSGRFVNGILDVILIELKKSGKLKKTGRGLIENTLRKKSAE
ncbi:MAG: transcription antitermination factor NusB [Melioribacteraceae bacterium]